MANNFKNAWKHSVGTTGVYVYATPTGSTSTIIGMTLCNILNTDITVDVIIHDDSTNGDVYMAKGLKIPKNSSYAIIGGDQKVVLESQDNIGVKSDTANSLDVFVSALEIS